MAISKSKEELAATEMLGVADAREQEGRDLSERARDHELVRRVLAGDKECYRQLVEKYQQRLFHLAFDIVRSRAEAEDVVQESFVKAYLSLKEFRNNSAFYTWIYRITHNMAIDIRRKMKRRATLSIESEGAGTEQFHGTIEENRLSAVQTVATTVASPQDELLRKEDAVRIQRALSELTEDHRLAITLREVDGLSYEEIADATGVAKGTVMSRLFYARKKLQELLGPGSEFRSPESRSTESRPGERENLGSSEMRLMNLSSKTVK